MQKELLYITSIGRKIHVKTASTFKSRLFGLMCRKEGEYGLLLYPCNSIHTCFMRYRLDVIFLSKQNTILSLKRNLKPFSFVRPVKDAIKAFEAPSSLNAFAFLKIGDTLVFSNNKDINE